MSITIAIIDGPLPAQPDAWPQTVETGTVGAALIFDGIVRGMEAGSAIDALDYEVYEPMASHELRRLADEICVKFDLLGLDVLHSRGRVPVGQCSFRLRIAARHREEGLRAMATFIERLKQDVPIWKKPVGEATCPT